MRIIRDLTDHDLQLINLRKRQRDIKQERLKLMQNAKILTSEWHDLEIKCREIENSRPVSDEIKRKLTEDQNLRVTTAGNVMLSRQHIQRFYEFKNPIDLLLALKSSIDQNEPIPEICGNWIQDASLHYLCALIEMQEGKATPCIADLLSIPSPTDLQSITPPIQRWFDQLRNEMIANDLAFLMTCFKGMTYIRARNLYVEHGRHVPRGITLKISKNFNSPEAMKKALPSKKEILKRYGSRYANWHYEKVTFHLSGLDVSTEMKQELKTQISTPESD